uniref:Putative trypsin-like serine protease n=1 Tax=Rhipicephalus microplus TaxID=6941 RepID=A0A6G5A6U1_RHIMP
MTPMMAKILIGLSLLTANLRGLSAQKETLNPEGCGMPSYKSMIVNGTEVKELQYPWAVFLATYFYPDFYACGGTIITKRHVLTAAHCLVSHHVRVQKVVVWYGSVDRRNAESVVASKMLIHKDYVETTDVNDIALLEVKNPFSFGKDVAPICIPMGPVPIVNKDAVVAGWGSLYIDGDTVDFLRQTSVTILPDKVCTTLFGKHGFSDTRQCCANKRSKGACKGDSGGPLMVRNKAGRFQQVGIVSYLMGTCGGDYNPQVYTRVTSYSDWLTRGVSSSNGYTYIGSPKADMLKPPFFIA